MAQEAFIRIYRELPRFDRERRFFPWMYRVAHNTCINLLHKRPREITPLDQILELPDDRDPSIDPDGSYEKADGRGKEPYCAQEVFCKEAQEMSVKKEYRDTRVFIPETHVEME